METKVLKKNKLAIIPAGIIEGIESFFDEEKKESWVIVDGKAMLFHKAPGNIQRMFAEAFMNDKKSREYLVKKMGITAFSEGFERWMRCIAGGLDHVPDFENGKFVADGFNNTCTDYECQHRGKFCSQKAGLQNHEVNTIRALKLGKSIAATASDLHVSKAGMKSRIEKIKIKLDASNMASMMAKAAEIGI